MRSLLLFILLIGFQNIVMWINIEKSTFSWDNITHPWETKIINQSLDVLSTSNLNNIKMVFCNESDQKKWKKSLRLNIRPWQSQEICVLFGNLSNTDIKINFEFVYWSINQDGAMVCGDNTSNNNEFSKHILHNTLTWIIVPASGTIIKKFTYKSPKNASGQSYGCLVYKLDKKEDIVFADMFLVTLRNASYIYISNTWSVYNFWRWDDIKDVYMTHKDIALKIIVILLTIWIITIIFSKKNNRKKHDK